MFKKVILIGIVIACITHLSSAADQDTVTMGKKLFEGSIRFENGGPSCITCHNVNSKDLVNGGLFSKDLTKVYSRYGDAFTGFLDNPQQGMMSAYGSNSFTDEEKAALGAFFKKVDAEGTDEQAHGYSSMLGFGFGGLIILIGLIYLIWSNRKKESVKKDIFDRQLSAIN